MSKIKMFHISKRLDWQIGDTLTCGKDFNPFWNTCASFDPKISLSGEQMTFFELFDRCSVIKPTEENVNALYKNLKTISKECAFYIREQVFEDIRRTYYPDKPSRQTCLWVCEADQLPYWKTMATDVERNLLTLDLEGDLFCGDDHWLTADSFSSIEYAKRAHHYWAGEMSSKPRKEYLFHGTAVVSCIEVFH